MKLSKIPSFAFDIDGVLQKGLNPIGSSNEMFKIQERYNSNRKKMNKTQISYIFLTNGSSMDEELKIKQLNIFSVPFQTKQVVMAHSPQRQYF